MFNGFIKTAAVTPNLIIGDVNYNVTEIIDQMYLAADAGVKILVFPELCITGAGCGDLFRQTRLIEAAYYGLQDILDASTDLDMLVIVGLPWRKDGKLYNVAAVVKNGSLLGLVPKVCSYSSVDTDEYRWFADGQEIAEVIGTDLMYGYDPDTDSAVNAGTGPFILRDDAEDDNEYDVSEQEDNESSAEQESYDSLSEDTEYTSGSDDALQMIEAPFGSDLIFECTDMEGLSIAVEIGEEYKTLYPPSESHACAGATIIVNPAAPHARAGHLRESENELRVLSERLVCAYVRAGAGPDESSTDFVSDGCRVIAEAGTILAAGKSLSNGMTISDIHIEALDALRRNGRSFLPIDEQEAEESYTYVGFMFTDVRQSPLHRKLERNPFVPAARQRSVCREILDIQSAALAKRMRHTGSKRLVLGLSGGLDSTLALLVSVNAAKLAGLSSSAVLCVSMPAFGTSDRTHDNSSALAECLGTEFREIDLKASLLQHFADIGHPVSVHDAAYENAQARERTQILMDLANMTGGLVVGTGDMSEAALGWCTYNGDQMSMYAVNAGIPKTVVRMIVHNYAMGSDDMKLRNVLLDILDTPVSPELLPVDDKGNISQRTEDIVGPYELHDFFLYYMLKYGFRPDRIYWLAKTAFGKEYTASEILRWLRVFYKRFFASQFKRSCSADGPKIFDISLSPRGGLVMPSDASSMEWTSEVDILAMIEDQSGEE